MNLISVIIPAYNEEENLPSTVTHLKNVFENLAREYEIVVVNNNSIDKTVNVAANLDCIVVNQNERNIGKTRNAGADKAHGDVFIFVDADSRPSKKLVTQALSALEKQPWTEAVSAITSFSHYPTFFSYGVWLYNIASKLLGLGVGQFIAIKATSFKKLNGFDERYYAFEEINFFKRLKQKFGRKSLLISLIPIKTSPRKFEKGKANSSKFLLLLVATILGYDIGKDKSQLDFWYGIKNSQINRSRANYYKPYVFTLLFCMLIFDILFLKINSPIRELSPYTTPLVFVLFLLLLIDNLKSLKIFLAIFIFTIVIEAIGVKTGFPFGFYAYNNNHMQIGLLDVPIFIGLAWFLITATTYRMTQKLLPMVIIVVVIDLFLEVFAGSNNLWQWQDPTFLTAPYQNYISWGIIAGIAYFVLKQTSFSLLYSTLSLMILMYYIGSILLEYSSPIGYLSMIFAIGIGIMGLNKGIKELLG